jgi:hypothetical protein
MENVLHAVVRMSLPVRTPMADQREIVRQQHQLQEITTVATPTDVSQDLRQQDLQALPEDLLQTNIIPAPGDHAMTTPTLNLDLETVAVDTAQATEVHVHHRTATLQTIRGLRIHHLPEARIVRTILTVEALTRHHREARTVQTAEVPIRRHPEAQAREAVVRIRLPEVQVAVPRDHQVLQVEAAEEQEAIDLESFKSHVC